MQFIRGNNYILMAITLASAFAESSCAARTHDCFVANTTVSLRGSVVRREVYGPPNFGSDPKNDSRRVISVLQLEEPLDICRGTSEEIDDSPLTNITQIQLINYSSGSPSTGMVTIRGALDRAQNAFHYTSAILVIE